jgi:hypothetical protein
MITVEMDDGDRDADGYKLVEGDKVTVNGRIDDDFYQSTTIEANSVYVEKLGTYFYASSLDEEDHTTFFSVETPVVVSNTVVRGTVTDVREDEFTVNTGLRRLTVEVEGMPYDPLDDEGYQKVRVGDYVRVSGNMEHDLFEGRELKADAVVKLYR